MGESKTFKGLGQLLVRRGGHLVLEQPLVELQEVLEDPLVTRLLAELAGQSGAQTLGELLLAPEHEGLAPDVAPLLWRQLEQALLRWVEGVRHQGPRGTAMAAGVPGPPEGYSAIGQWAREQGVQDCLDHPVDQLRPWLSAQALAWLGQAPRDLMVRHCVGVQPSVGAGAVPRPMAEAFRAASRAYLWHCAGRRFIELQRRQRWSQPLNQDRCQTFSARLRQVLRQIKQWPGVDDPVVFARAPLTVVADPPSLKVRFFQADESRPAVATQLSLVVEGDEDFRLQCRCSRSERRGCPHRRVLVEWALDILHDPADPLHREMVEALKHPAWSRALTALRDVAVKAVGPAAGGEERQLVWRLGGRGASLVAQAAVRTRRPSGRWGRGRRIALTDLLEHESELLDGRDRHVAAALALAEHRGAAGRKGLFWSTALDALVGHDRVFQVDHPLRPLVVERAPLVVGFLPYGEGYQLGLRLGKELIPPDKIKEYRVDKGALAAVDSSSGHCLVAPLGAREKPLLQVWTSRDVVFPPDSHSALLDVLASLQPYVEIDAPHELRGRSRPAVATIVVRFDLLSRRGLALSFWVRPLGKGPQWPPGKGPLLVFGRDNDERFSVERDFAAEQDAAYLLAERLELIDDDGSFRWEFAEQQQALTLLTAVRALGPDVPVEWPENVRPWQLSRLSAGNLQVRVRRSADWFAVEGDAEVEGDQVSLAQLLEAVQGGARYVELAPGRFARIEKGLRQRLREASQLVHRRAKEGLALTTAFPVEAEAVLAHLGELNVDDAWRDLQRRFGELDELNVSLPQELQASLREYQQQGYQWVARLAHWSPGACLADDMGLGKTVQTLALLLRRAAQGPALVVAPTSVCDGWVTEATRFAPSLKVVVYRGPRRRIILDGLAAGVVMVTSYDVMALDIKVLEERNFSTLVLDEAQAIKNPQTQRARAACRLRAEFRLALSGTPVENHLGELWSLFHAINPQLLGSWARFAADYATPIEREGNEERQARLSQLLGPFLMRRTKGEVAPELPQRTEVVHPVELSEQERSLYHAARREALDSLARRPDLPDNKVRVVVLAAITRLRQLACHPRLLNPDSLLPSSKLSSVLKLLEQLQTQGQRALVFSQFTRHLGLLREALDYRELPYLYLDGKTPARRRAELVQRWQQQDSSLFLISLKAGGTGLNLAGADYVFHLDPWWNPAVEDQASDRSHRIGQDRPLTVVRFISQGTIEEAVLSLHARKRELANRLLEGARAAKNLSVDELSQLLCWGDGEAVVEAEAHRLPPSPDQKPPAPETRDSEAKGASVSLPQVLIIPSQATRVAEDFLDRLAEERVSGLIRTDSTLKLYRRAAMRFARFVASFDDGVAASEGRALAEWSQLYVEALQRGELDAPAGEATVARTVLRRMVRVLTADASAPVGTNRTVL
jgi:superfamily II DNA or RNA helicase